MTGRQTARLRSGLVVVQVSVSLVLLVGAGLSLRTLQNAYTVDPGYNVEGVLLADVNLDVSGYDAAAQAEVSGEFSIERRQCPASNQSRRRGPLS